jgi:hypothetical protein
MRVRFKEKETRVLAHALTLALFQPTFAKASVGKVPRNRIFSEPFLNDLDLIWLFRKPDNTI